MALKVTQAQVDTLTAQQAKVFRAMKDDQYTQNHLLLQDVNAAGGNMTISQLDHIGRDLVSRGFAQEDTANGKWKYRRARITPNHVPDRSENYGKPTERPGTATTAERALLDMVTTARGYASEIESQCAGLSRALDIVTQIAEEIATRPTGEVVSPAELAELREKASNWDDLQKLMGRK